MGLFTGEDVEAQPRWWDKPWLLAFLVAGFPVDMVVALITGMPQLEAALLKTELPIPAPTLLLIALGRFLAHGWWLALLPLVMMPLLATWRWRDGAVAGLKTALLVELVVFALICLFILLPLKTIVEATP